MNDGAGKNRRVFAEKGVVTGVFRSEESIVCLQCVRVVPTDHEMAKNEP